MMVWWRFTNRNHAEWRFGYKTHVSGNLYRMGLWNGDTIHGPVVDLYKIETKRYE